MDVGNAERILSRTITGQLCPDFGSAALRMFERFENHDRRSFADHKTVALAVEGSHGMGRIVVVLREGAETMKAADAERMDHAVGAAGQHHVDLAHANHLGRFANGLAAGGASGNAIGVGALGIELGRQVRGRHV